MPVSSRLRVVRRGGYTRTATITAYHSAIQSGLISGTRRVVFDFIWKHHPTTQPEAAQALISTKINWGVVTTRFSELEDMDLIEQLGLVINPTTGHYVTLYGVTGRSPTPLVKKRKPIELYVLFSLSSGYLGYASPDAHDLDYWEKWFKGKGYADTIVMPMREKVEKVKLVRPGPVPMQMPMPRPGSRVNGNGRTIR